MLVPVNANDPFLGIQKNGDPFMSLEVEGKVSLQLVKRRPQSKGEGSRFEKEEKMC